MRPEIHQVGGDATAWKRPIHALVQDARIGARMLKENDIIAESRRDEALADIRTFIEKHKIPLERISRRLDMSQATISQVLSGSYKADPNKHIRALAKFCDEYKDRA